MGPAFEGRDDFDDERLAALLVPWAMRSVRVGVELSVHRDRSRVWLIHDGALEVAAKVTFDGPVYVEPGLRIAIAVDDAGIPTGRPVRTQAGDLCSPIPRSVGRPWTIALLSWVPGSPIDPSEPGAPNAAGDLLGRVHTALAGSTQLPPAGDLLRFYESEAVRLGGAVGGRLTAAVRRVDAMVQSGHLQCGVLYGDPSPEILRNPLTRELALIDWGTPSWGPLLFDLLTWERFFGDGPAAGRAAAEMRAGYLRRCPARAAQLPAADLVDELIAAVRDTWSR